MANKHKAKSKERQLLPLPVRASEQEPCAIGVCVGRSCRKAGSKDVRGALDREVWRRRLDERVSVRTVGCLDRCREGPSVDLTGAGSVITHVRPADAARLIDRVMSSE
ncbi:MAG: (2Fe-2S) ferredoxin domain-containing protein [Chloroflexi bacterium]|nr:(2Fe-2S) ferredoxin domain-containing protein [Chloroflexota bacterium]